MSKVYNWQLKREMDYAYESNRPKKQWCMVFDLNKCIACQTCTLACKTTWTSGKGQEYMFWNNVETKPWGGYPLGWDVNILEKLGQQEWSKAGRYEGKTVFEAAIEKEPNERAIHFKPEDEDWMYPNIGEDDSSGNVPTGCHYTNTHENWFFYLPRTCAHCTYPACLAACPRKAIYKREEDGIVLIDQSRCQGYGECMKACPYKKSMYNSFTRVSEKCIGCYPAVEQGRQPMCVQNCIGKIRIMGFVNTPENAREDNPVDYLIHKKKIALPLYSQLGLEPNIYYIPPVHVDKKYLTQMFGPDVELAIKRYRGLKDDIVTRSLFMLMGSTDSIIHSFKVVKDQVTALDEKGEVLVTVPITEPVIERGSYDNKLKASRNNTP
jgi:nitrate reductase beta subunit